jgi:hypothetical protein
MRGKMRGDGRNYLPHSLPAFTAGELVFVFGIWAGTVTQFAQALETDRATIFRLVSSGAVVPLTCSGSAENKRACMSFVDSEFDRLRQLLVSRN